MGVWHLRTAILSEDDTLQQALTESLGNHGCTVSLFDDPAGMLLDIERNGADLVIAEDGAGGRDSYALALRVGSVLGVCPPRTLLVSEMGNIGTLVGIAPSMVIGVVSKPIDAGRFSDLLSVLAAARTRCPGLLSPEYRGACPGEQPCCASPRYAECPHYDRACGRKLQLWISTRSEWKPAGLDGAPAGDSASA
jgi:hypothetical protein